MPLADIFNITAILDGGPSVAKEELVRQLATLLADAGHIPEADVPANSAAVLRREHLGSTGIGRGLAVPPAKHAAVQRPLGVLAVCRPPVWFDALDGEPVDIVALLLAPPDRPGQHLGEASRWSEGLVRRLADEEFCRRLRQARSAEEIGEIVLAEGGMLFGAACCRRQWDLLLGEGRRAVEVAERFAEGLADKGELDAARTAFMATLGGATGAGSFAGIAVSYLMAEARHDPAGYALDLSPWAAQASENQAEVAAQAGIVRCLFGSPPFEPVKIRPEWLALGDGVVAKLARGIYDERAFDRMPILADALEDAGCGDEHLLGHLRGPGPHARGCFVIASLLGRG